jgi:hypothetical protein
MHAWLRYCLMCVYKLTDCRHQVMRWTAVGNTIHLIMDIYSISVSVVLILCKLWRRPCGPQRRSWQIWQRENILPSPEIEPRTAQPLASRCTAYTAPCLPCTEVWCQEPYPKTIKCYNWSETVRRLAPDGTVQTEKYTMVLVSCLSPKTFRTPDWHFIFREMVLRRQEASNCAKRQSVHVIGL